MTVEPKRILILTAAVGSGHISAARAIQVALEEQYGAGCEVSICNPFDEPVVPAIIRNAQAEHTDLVHDFPGVYALGLRITDSELTVGIGNIAGLIALSDAMSEVISRYRPDVVAATHPLQLEPLLSYAEESHTPFRVVTVVTDLTRVHRLWYNPNVDLCLVPTDRAKQLAIEVDMPAEKLVVSGLPVDPAFGNTEGDQTTIRKSLNLEPDRFTVLAVGSKRVLDLQAYIVELNRRELPVQIIAVAGGDNELYEDLQQITWLVPVALFDYVEEMPKLMHAADCLISKAGGLIVAESLAAGLPMLIIPSTPIHEQGNAEYVSDEGAGAQLKRPDQLHETLERWLVDDRAIWQTRAGNAQRIGRPRAAYTVAHWLWQMAESQPSFAKEQPDA